MKFEECKIGARVILKSGVVETLTDTGEINHLLTPSAKEFRILKLHYLTKNRYDTPNRPFYQWYLRLCLPVMSTRPHRIRQILNVRSTSRQSNDAPQTSDYKLDFEVRREKNELSAYYHGIKLATVRCHPDDAYDEEFGLHLLLRRACLKLKDEHTVVETVEELL